MGVSGSNHFKRNAGVLLGKMALREIFGPTREKVTGGRRTLQNEKLHNMYSSPNICY
jgi:hypothetical protein